MFRYYTCFEGMLTDSQKRRDFMRRLPALIILTLLAPFLTFGDGAAAVEKKRSFGLRKEGTAHIQLRSMMAPIKKSAKSKRTTNSPVTVIMTIGDSSRVGTVCNKSPRINDALMGAWYKQPILQDYLYARKDHKGKTNVNYRRTAAQKAEDKRLMGVINRAIGSNDVTQILIVGGIMRMGGGTITKLPFSSVNGCDELQ